MVARRIRAHHTPFLRNFDPSSGTSLSQEASTDRSPKLLSFLMLIDLSPATRAAHPFMNLTNEAKEIIKSLEAERDTAKAAGTTGDWWNGSHKKGMTSKMAKHHKEGREMVRQSYMGMKEMLGIETLGTEGFDHIGFEEDIDDDDLEGLGEGDDEGVDGGETVSRVLESKEGGMEEDQLFGGDDEEALVELMGETGKRDVVHNNAEDLMDID
ncbi:MAG: hypothetical protein LQ341_005394 [Variospora aurantia]|nr:MAG: hypothetical protein LQ341_005394 [Variospora aurantia]